MPVANSTIGQKFDELADLLDIEGANPFRVRAYRNAARVVSQWPQNLADLLRTEKELPKIPGLGADLSSNRIAIRSSMLNRAGQRWATRSGRITPPNGTITFR